MDIYNTTYLSGVVANLKRPNRFLLDTFFPSVVQAEVEEIKFDVEEGKRRLAPFVSPLREGKVVESLGFSTKTFKPAYVKDKRVFDPNKPLKRRAGEQIGGTMAPGDRIQANLVSEMADQSDMLTRRLEVMAAEAMRTGKVTVKGDGFDTVVVDFGRNANHTVDLSGGAAEWGDTGVDPMENIEDWSGTVLQNSGAPVTDVVMDPAGWKLFRNNVDLDKLFDKRRANEGARMTTVQSGRHIQFMGTDGHRNYWVYSDWYIDPDTETETPILPNNTVILASSGTEGVDGVRHFGAIRDEDAGYQALEMFPKSWTTKDPSVRFLMMQSAPLVVPYRPDAVLCATVT